jgi:RNA-binding protein
MLLNSKQRAFLKKKAHDIKAIVRVGKDGFSENIGKNLETALVAKELVKVKILQNAEQDANEIRETANKLAEISNSQVVDVIGRTVIFYKENEKKRIVSEEVNRIK